MAQIKSGASSDLLTVDATSKAARVTLYDASGNVLISANRAAVAETAAGMMNAGKDYKLARTLRVSSTGTLHVAGDQTAMLQDSYEGTTRNLNQWVETLTTMASAQAVATGLTLNSGAITTINTGILEASHRHFPVSARTALVFRTRLRNTAVNNQTTEFGFSDCSAAITPQITNGVYFRKDASGNLQGVWSFNGSDVVSTSVLTAPATTDYAYYEVFLEDSRATFQIWSAAGALISSAVLEIPATTARQFGVTHIQCFHRIYNAGSAPASGGQLIINLTTVQMVDAWSQREHRIQQSGMGYNSLTSPTAFTQLANYANSAAPASATLSNTAAGYTTLGGQFQWAAVAGAETDYALFGWQNPSPYTFYFTGIRINTWNMGAAAAATPTLLQWGLAFNSSTVSLATAAPYSPMRQAIGAQQLAASAAIGVAFDKDVVWIPDTPIAVQPARFLHIILKSLVSAATASEIIRGVAAVGGFFE